MQLSETQAPEADPTLISGAFGCATVSGVRIGGFTSRAVADGAEASTADVQTRVLNWCFGVSMLGR